MDSPYPEALVGWQANASRSASRVVPLLIDQFSPSSVVDVGCGYGAWLAAFLDLGVEDVWGVDGAYVVEENLLIPADRFVPHDLADGSIPINRSFDLALSLEVGEHLPPEAAAPFVESLTRLAPVVVFGAAVPGQGGLHHVNEQWPAYWSDLFGRHGFQPHDTLRPTIWNDNDVEWWYRQNTIVYAPGAPRPPPLALVHPLLFEYR